MKKTILLFIIAVFQLSGNCQNTQLKNYYTTVYDTSGIEDFYSAINGGCSLGCAFGWDYKCSSVLPPQGSFNYLPINMSDGDVNTAWIEGKRDYGIGERITIYFDTDSTVRNVPLKGIDIVNGYAKNSKVWQENSRVKSIKILHNDKFVFNLTLQDTIYPQGIFLNGQDYIYLSHGDTVTLVITDVYKGEKYKDTAITEINLHGAH